MLVHWEAAVVTAGRVQCIICCPNLQWSGWRSSLCRRQYTAGPSQVVHADLSDLLEARQRPLLGTVRHADDGPTCTGQPTAPVRMLLCRGPVWAELRSSPIMQHCHAWHPADLGGVWDAQEAKQHLQNGGDADDESDGLLDGEQGDLGSEDDDVEDVTDDYLNRLTGQVPGHPALWNWVQAPWHACAPPWQTRSPAQTEGAVPLSRAGEPLCLPLLHPASLGPSCVWVPCSGSGCLRGASSLHQPCWPGTAQLQGPGQARHELPHAAQGGAWHAWVFAAMFTLQLPLCSLARQASCLASLAQGRPYCVGAAGVLACAHPEPIKLPSLFPAIRVCSAPAQAGAGLGQCEGS